LHVRSNICIYISTYTYLHLRIHLHSGGSDTRADVAPVLAPPAGTAKVLSFSSVYTTIYKECCRVNVDPLFESRVFIENW